MLEPIILQSIPHKGCFIIKNYITVYTKPNCPACRITKRYLTEHNIPFAEKEALSEDNRPTLRKWGYQSAPVVLVDFGEGETSPLYYHFNGFNPKMLQQVVAQAKDLNLVG